MTSTSDTRRLVMLIAALAAAFGRALDEPTLAGYTMALDDVPLADVEQAVRRALRECRHLPRPAELRELAGLVVLTPSERAALAWTVAQKAARRPGAYATVRFDDPVTHATIVRMGGWQEFCDIPQDELGYARAQFERVYAALLRVGVTSGECSALLGIHDTTNGNAGWEGRQPVLEIECRLPPLPADTVRPSAGTAALVEKSKCCELGERASEPA